MRACSLLAPVILRRDPALGFVAILFLFAVVWATDIAAYFAGRAHRRAEAVAGGQPEQDLVGRASAARSAASRPACLS